MDVFHLKLTVVAILLLAFWVPTLGACQGIDPVRTSIPSVPATPKAVDNILAVRRFTLAEPYLYTWSKEPRKVAVGLLVVLEVDPAYVVPRDDLEPVLYAGSVVVHRLNHGHQSGRVIGIVPDSLDLATTPIWFGAPELPARVTSRTVDTERARAERAGIRAFAATRVSSAQRPVVEASNLAELLRTAGAELVYEFSPQEKDLAESWRLPVAKGPIRKKSK